MAAKPPYLRLNDLPLWRLLVALDDAERIAGPDSPTAQAIARVVRERLRQEPDEVRSAGKEPAHA
jgi:hypothetical protein